MGNLAKFGVERHDHVHGVVFGLGGAGGDRWGDTALFRALCTGGLRG
jgi:hypothetical protein